MAESACSRQLALRWVRLWSRKPASLSCVRVPSARSLTFMQPVRASSIINTMPVRIPCLLPVSESRRIPRASAGSAPSEPARPLGTQPGPFRMFDGFAHLSQHPRLVRTQGALEDKIVGSMVTAENRVAQLQPLQQPLHLHEQLVLVQRHEVREVLAIA